MEQTDKELAADIRQLWQELVKAENEMERRGYDVNKLSYGRKSDMATVTFDRKETDVL